MEQASRDCCVRAPDLAVVIPVLNEAPNVAPMVAALRAALGGIAWEAIFVDDDSSDGTRAAVAAIGRKDARVRLLHRIGRRGLASAFVEGALASLAPYVAAIDGDLQHDETLLPAMYRALSEEGFDLAVGSRYLAGGGVGGWDQTRAGLSRFATRLAFLVLKTPMSDPMSGFFMLRRETLEAALPQLSAIGFKILLDVVASLPAPPRIKELPYQFRSRSQGESKLDAGVLRDYLLLLADKLVGAFVPVRFVLFAAVGALGILFHLLVLRLCLGFVTTDFALAQSLATAAAIVANFWLNNFLTFRDRRLKGLALLRGLFVFALICSVGAVANVSIAVFLFSPAMAETWWLAGLAGAAMSLVWNYAMSSLFTWNSSRRA